MEENADGIEKKWVYSIKDIVCLRIERVNLRIGHFGETIIFYEKYELAFLLIFYFLIPRIGKKRPQLPQTRRKKLCKTCVRKNVASHGSGAFAVIGDYLQLDLFWQLSIYLSLSPSHCVW